MYDKKIMKQITSLTLMTIMLAGGMTMAAPGVIPDANAEIVIRENLSVSSDRFGGPMILEIIVNDPDFDETDQAQGVPNVTFDGSDLIMTQGDDGSWYAYVAHEQNVAAFGTNNDIGFNFGDTGCLTTFGRDLPENHKVYCNTLDDRNDDNDNNVIKGAPNPSPFSSIGQIDLDTDDWPLIQTFNDLSDDADIDVVYRKSGSPQTIQVEYDGDMDDYASWELDRTSYPLGAEVHLTINDNQLNIDPTDFDTWTFDTVNEIAFYESVNPNDARNNATTIMKNNGYGDNGVLIIKPNPSSATNSTGELTPILKFKTNDDSNDAIDKDDNPGFVTVEETDQNSGVFESTDSDHISHLYTTSNEGVRSFDFLIDYNDDDRNAFVNYFAGAIDMDASSINGTWNSGEPITVELTDQDFNKNTRIDDDLSVKNGMRIPTIEIGNPFTLEDIISVTLDGEDLVISDSKEIQAQQMVSTKANNAVKALEIELGIVGSDGTGGLRQEIIDADMAVTIAQTTLDNLDTTNTNAIGNALDALTDAEDLLQEKLDVLAYLSNDAFINAVEKALDESDKLQRLLDDNPLASPFSKLLPLEGAKITNTAADTIIIDTDYDASNLNLAPADNHVSQFLNYDLRSLETDDGDFKVTSMVLSVVDTTGTTVAIIPSDLDDMDYSERLDLVQLKHTTIFEEGQGTLRIEINISGQGNANYAEILPIAIDIFTFGQHPDDGSEDANTRYNDAIYRFEAEETDNNTGRYVGTVEYIMLNQFNYWNPDTYDSLETISDDLDIIVHEDLTGEDDVRITYYDIDNEGVETQISDQEAAPTHDGEVSLDANTYKVADTVTITLVDADLNTDSAQRDSYRVAAPYDVLNNTGNGIEPVPGTSDPTRFQSFSTVDTVTKFNDLSDNIGEYVGDTVAVPNEPQSLLLDVTFGAKRWVSCDPSDGSPLGGFSSAISQLVETDTDTGVFTATFQIPDKYCGLDDNGDLVGLSPTGVDLEVNYQDFRDFYGETLEVSDSAGASANTGTVSLERTVYPVPWGAKGHGSEFALQSTALGTSLPEGVLTVHVTVEDPDYDVSASGVDEIAENVVGNHGPVTIKVIRGGETVVLGTAGGERAEEGVITVGSTVKEGVTKEYGPITEVRGDSGQFELDLDIRFTDGPHDSSCPERNDLYSTLITDRFGEVTEDNDVGSQHCILQGDILQVEYRDPTDASGSPNTITDSATFDLRNGQLQTDKPAYIIGSDMILTLIEPDFDLDNDGAQSYTLDLIEWDSDAAKVTMGELGNIQNFDNAAAFDPEPNVLRETGDSTGIFQVVIEIPESLSGDKLERGEEIILEYLDQGPAGADYVGHEDEEITTTVFTSNFGATIELDQKVYTWTDKVYITIVAPDHNNDSDLVDEIGNDPEYPIEINTRVDGELDNYKLVETGTDTGIFTGEVILTGFYHDADGTSDGSDDTNPRTEGNGPTDGFIEAEEDDGITISFEFSDNETVISSSIIRWNVGEVQWLEAAYPANGQGTVRVIDPDMNLDPESVNNFDIEVNSGLDSGAGISLTVNETNEATGIFEGTVQFTTTDSSSGHRLRVSEGDTITATYEDHTLPDPDSPADDLDITATTLIGSIVPPLERAPAQNLRLVDSSGHTIGNVNVGQQVQVAADFRNGQDEAQPFAYLVQIQDGNGVTVKLDWFSGDLEPNQATSPKVSWTPDTAGSYTATVFVWESIDNPAALSPSLNLDIQVS